MKGTPPVFNHHPMLLAVWVVCYVLWFVPETVLSYRLKSRHDAQKADRGSKAVVIASINVGIALGFFAAFRATSFYVGVQWKTMFGVGIVVWLAGIAFRLYSMRVLGRFFTYDVAISREQHVVEAGPYRWLRHPSYSGSLLAALGFGMTLTNWLALVFPAACLALGYLYRIPLEERALLGGLGPPYQDYMQRTWRLIPFVF